MQLLPQIFRRTVEDADTEIKRLAEREQSLIAERQAKTQELAASKARVGEDYLDRGEAGLADLTMLRSQIEAIDRAIVAARNRRLEAVRAKHRSRADELRRQAWQANDKQAELDRLESETGELLARLSELEGVTFTSSILSCQPINDWYSPVHGRVEPWFGPADMIPGPTGAHYATPKSRQLRTEIQAMLDQAAEVERQAEHVTLEEVSSTGDRSAAA